MMTQKERESTPCKNCKHGLATIEYCATCCHTYHSNFEKKPEHIPEYELYHADFPQSKVKPGDYWVAMDEDGDIIIYKNKPKMCDDVWLSGDWLVVTCEDLKIDDWKTPPFKVRAV